MCFIIFRSKSEKMSTSHMKEEDIRWYKSLTGYVVSTSKWLLTFRWSALLPPLFMVKQIRSVGDITLLWNVGSYTAADTALTSQRPESSTPLLSSSYSQAAIIIPIIPITTFSSQVYISPSLTPWGIGPQRYKTLKLIEGSFRLDTVLQNEESVLVLRSEVQE